MSKKLIIIIVNFVVVLVVTFVLIAKIKDFQGIEDVYVAKEMIRQGQMLTPDMIQLKQVTLNHMGDTSKLVSYYNDVVTPQNLDVLQGKYAAYDIIPGEIILQGKLVSEDDLDINYIERLPKGYYAYVVKNTISGGIIKIDDYIDLYVFDKEQNMSIEESALRHLRVYDLRDKNGNSVNIIEDSSNNGEKQQVEFVVLGLNDFQLKKIMYYENTGANIKMAIRNRNNVIFNYFETEYPYYAITSDADIVTEAREKEILDQIKKKKENINSNDEEQDNGQDGIVVQPPEQLPTNEIDFQENLEEQDSIAQ